MTLKINVPDVESRIRELAAARQMDAEDYLVELVTSHLPTAIPAPQPKLSAHDRKGALRRFSDRISTDTPLLSDKAFSRENLYPERREG